DFYVTVKPRATGQLVARLSAPQAEAIPELTVAFHRIEGSHSPSAVIAAEPNGTWQQAQTFQWGQTIYGSDDVRPYAPAPNSDRYAALVAGFQWFRFTYHGKTPRLAYFVVDITDREVPLDVDIFKLGKNASGHPDVVPYKKGQFIYQVEATQNY